MKTLNKSLTYFVAVATILGMTMVMPSLITTVEAAPTAVDQYPSEGQTEVYLNPGFGTGFNASLWSSGGNMPQWDADTGGNVFLCEGVLNDPVGCIGEATEIPINVSVMTFEPPVEFQPPGWVTIPNNGIMVEPQAYLTASTNYTLIFMDIYEDGSSSDGYSDWIHFTTGTESMEYGGDAVCGDSFWDAQAGESCDGWDLGGAMCTHFGFSGGELGCNPSGHAEECQYNFDGCSGGTASVCGNGTQEPGEACDDGNTDDTDACTSWCTINDITDDEGYVGCTGYTTDSTCNEDWMCMWDYQMQECWESFNACNNYLTESNCQGDTACFWDGVYYNSDTDSYGQCIENFGAGYPTWGSEDIYIFPNPNNSTATMNWGVTEYSLSDGDPYAQSNRPDQVMNEVPRDWSEMMAPLIVGFSEQYATMTPVANYIKLHQFDDLATGSSPWIDKTSLLTFSTISVAGFQDEDFTSCSSETVEDDCWRNWCEWNYESLSCSDASWGDVYEYMGVTSSPLEPNMVYRVSVKGATKSVGGAAFAGQTSACPDGSGNLCFTSTFKTGQGMMPGADYQGGSENFGDNFDDMGCIEGTTIGQDWPFEGATGIFPDEWIKALACGDTDTSNACARLVEKDDGGDLTTITINTDTWTEPSGWSDEARVVSAPDFPMAPNTGYRYQLDLACDGTWDDFALNFTTGDSFMDEGDWGDFEGDGPGTGMGWGMMMMGDRRTEVKLVDSSKDPYVATSEVFITMVCGDVTMPEMTMAGPMSAPPEMGMQWWMDAGIQTGSSSVWINGIPDPTSHEDFTNTPCLVFLRPDTSGLAALNTYKYTGGFQPPASYTAYAESEFDKPMPPATKYAEVYIGTDSENEPTVYLEVQELVSGTLSGTVCLDDDASGDDDTCGAGDTILADARVEIFTMGPPQFGGQGWWQVTTDSNGDYSQADLTGGVYMVEMHPGPDQNFNAFGNVTVSGNTTHDVVIDLGNTLNLTFDNTAECWETGEGQDWPPMVFFDFFPVQWSFDKFPVWGDYNFSQFTDNGDSTYSLAVTGFGDGEYMGHIEVPGCMGLTGSQTAVTFDGGTENLDLTLGTGLTLSGTVVNEDGEPMQWYPFGAHTVFTDFGGPGMFGGFTGSGTNENGGFEMPGLYNADPGWQFESFGMGGPGTSMYSFACGSGDLPANCIFDITEDTTDFELVVQEDKRVNITVTDGANTIDDAMIDINCDSGKMVHLGHARDIWTYLPPGDSCNFMVHTWSRDLQPYDESIDITSGTTAQNVTITLEGFNRDLGDYYGELKADKITVFPGGDIGYKGYVGAPSPADFDGHTVTFTYPSTVETISASSPHGDCSASSGTVTCTTANIGASNTFDLFVNLTVPTDYEDSSLAVGLNLNSDPINISNVYTQVTSLSINAPKYVAEGADFTVYGEAYQGANVTLSYIDSTGTTTTLGSTNMQQGDAWYTFKDKSISTAGTYTLKVQASDEGVSASATSDIIVGGDYVNISSVVVTGPNGTLPTNDNTGISSGQLFELEAFTIDIVFSDTIVSPIVSFMGTDYTMVNTTGNTWRASITEGWTGYGNVEATLTGGADNDLDYGAIAEILILIDPSGYIYDTSDGNRIEGATATLYQLVDANSATVTSITGPDADTDGSISDAEEGTTSGDAVGTITGCYTTLGTLDTDLCRWSVWDATASGQVNPQTTDSEGKYGWNVPQGWYRVAFQKDNDVNGQGGYSINYSRDVYVPPAETTLNLNLGAYDSGAPSVSTVSPADAATNVPRNVKPKIVFSEQMLATTINSTNIKLLNAGSPVTATISYDTSSRTATITPAANLASITTYTIRLTTSVADDSSNGLAATVNYSFTTGTTADSLAPTSSANVATGSYSSTQTVTLSALDGGSACADCIIYYTNDGTTPSSSSNVYTAALTISSTTTLKYFAVDSAGNEEATANTKVYTIAISTLNPPENLAVTNLGVTGASLTWDAVSGATSYSVYRSTSSGSGYTLDGTASSALYSDYGLNVTTTYYYKVSSVNTAGESSLSGAVTLTTGAGSWSTPDPDDDDDDTPPPAAPPAGAPAGSPATDPGDDTADDADDADDAADAVDTSDETATPELYSDSIAERAAEPDLAAETEATNSFTEIQDRAPTNEQDTNAINFIAYGTSYTDQIQMSSRDRKGLLIDYKDTFGKLPDRDRDWSDVDAMARGERPIERNLTKEAEALGYFINVNHRLPESDTDWTYVAWIAYKMRPAARDLSKEIAAIASYGGIFNDIPDDATEWAIVRAMAYIDL